MYQQWQFLGLYFCVSAVAVSISNYLVSKFLLLWLSFLLVSISWSFRGWSKCTCKVQWNKCIRWFWYLVTLKLCFLFYFWFLFCWSALIDNGTENSLLKRRKEFRFLMVKSSWVLLRGMFGFVVHWVWTFHAKGWKSFNCFKLEVQPSQYSLLLLISAQ